MKYEYVGNELELFSQAHTWKNYYSQFIKPYLHGNVLEVGAGIGGTTKVLCDNKQDKWICLEPDPNLCKVLQENIDNHSLPNCCEVFTGTANNLPTHYSFNSAIYIDVLEHIENDYEEIQTVLKHLDKSGYLIILAPAHQYLFSKFDKELGHFRRYDKNMLTSIMPPNLELESIKYLDTMGIVTNFFNKLVLKQKMPTAKQIEAWDKLIVPISRIIDPLLGYYYGKSILGIWKKN